MSVFVDVQQLVTKPIGQSNWRESIQDPYTSQKHETINVFGQALNDLQPNANKVSTWPICIGEGPKAMAKYWADILSPLNRNAARWVRVRSINSILSTIPFA